MSRRLGDIRIILIKRRLLSKCSVLFLLTILSVQTSFAQLTIINKAEDNYRAVHWGIDEGLGKERWHNAILKDVNGFLWIGSNYGELSRFDGSSFKRYDPDKNKPGAIATNNCLAFVEDSLHNIWIGRFQGLSRYDIKADTFTNFSSRITSGTSDEHITPFWATSNEIFCIEGGTWITTYNVHSFARKKLLKIAETDKVNIGFPAAYAIFDSASKSIWMLKYDEEGLVQLSLSTGRVTQHSRVVETKKPHSYVHKGAEAMCYDRRRNCIWINSHDGLIRFTLNDRQFHHIDPLNQLENLKEYERYVGIDIDPQGRIWFATAPKGIIIYDPSSQSVMQPFFDSTLQNKVTDGNLKIYCDRDGIIWTSYWSVNGIYQLVPFSPSVHRYTANALKPDSLSSLVIYTMMGGEHGSLWIGTPNEGLNIFNPETETFRVLREKDLPGIKSKGIVPMVIDTLRKISWLNAGPPDRVYEMDMQTRKCKPVIFKDTANRVLPPINIISNMARSFKNGFVFLDAGYGIFEVNNDSPVARLVITQYQTIFRMTIGEGRKLFLRTTPDHGVTYYYANGKWIKTPHLLDSLEWSDIFFDKTDETYWVGVHKELRHYDKGFHKIRSYTDEEGLIGDPLSIIADGRGNIWFNNDRKVIAILNIKTGIISTLSEQDGYQKQSFDWTSPKATEAGGNLYFAGNFLAHEKIGLDRIRPEKFVQSPPSFVYLNSLKINQHDFPLSTGVNNLQELSLRYFENKISLETGIINYYSRGKSHIRYKLEVKGKNAEWEYAPAYYTIRYEDLPPGKYKLVIQASSAANEFNGPEKILSINIAPAFWNTWWFRITVAIFVIILIYAFMRWRIQRRFRLQLEQSEKERQLAELKQKATELEMQALRAQMNPHFIFNSLNSINRFILQNNKTQASEYLTKFSKLVRLILQNSQVSLIPLESELESLELYLNLEAVRFNYHFDYKISVPKDLDISALQVPPLILQPYVENAIWHGLMHKEEKGQLDVEVSEEDDHLYFKITDNGVGREKAAALASKSATKHKSMGLRITAHRIAIIQKSQALESPVTINDLVNADGSAAGTEVTIKMPLIYD
jgi:ligand-binding sensor domain-containing protein